MNLQEFHKATDEFIAECFNPKRTTVKPPCASCTSAYCCDEPVYATADEVDAMLASLTPEQTARLKERLMVWMEKFKPWRDIPQPAAIPYRLDRITCPFLVDRRCIAYESRPHGCRAWFALNGSELCEASRRREQRFAEFPHGGGMTVIYNEYIMGCSKIEMDHLGAVLVRRLFDPEFFTAASETYTVEGK